jgi:hypothetical protein
MPAEFSSQDLTDSQALLDELFTEVQKKEGTMAGGVKLGVGGRTLDDLRATRISFGNPANDLIRLTPKLFSDLDLELSEIHKRQMRDQFDFYYMTLTLSLQVRGDVQFRRVIAWLGFGPKGPGEPIVQTLFPQSLWKPVLSWGGGLKLGLDANLNWSVAVPDGFDLQGVPAELQGKVGNENALKALIAMPDFSYELGRAEIAAAGEGNSECSWDIAQPSLAKTHNLKFGLVFKVPRGTRRVELLGQATAEPSFNWLIANVSNVFSRLNTGLQDLLGQSDDQRRGRERLPIGDHEHWSLDLPD